MKRLILLLCCLLAQGSLAQSAFGQRLLAEDTERIVRICGVVAVGDGFTPVTTLDLSMADFAEALREGTATLDISAATFTAVTAANGCYDLTLSTTATSTVGELTIWIADTSLVLPVWEYFQVVEEAVYAACCAASATPLTAAAVVDNFETQSQADPTGFHVNVLEIGGTAQTANDNGADINEILLDTAEIGAAGAGLTNINLPNQTMDITGSITGNLSGSVGSVTGAVGSVTGAVGSVTGAVGSVTGAVGSVAGNVTGSVGSLAAQAQTDVQTASAAALDAEDGANFTAIPGEVLAMGACDSGSTTTCVDAGQAAVAADYWRGTSFKPLTGPVGQTRCVVAYDEVAEEFTFVPPLTAAITTNTYQIIRDTNCVGVNPAYTP